MTMRSDKRSKSLVFSDTPPYDAKQGEELFERWQRLRTSTDTPLPRRLRSSSVGAYRSMWRKFLRFLAAERLGYGSIDAPAVERFLRQPGSPRQITPGAHTSWRYLKLLAELFELARAEGARDDNPALTLLEARAAPERPERVPVVLDSVQEMAVRQALDQQEVAAGHWKDLRDWAMLHVVLGGGLKPYEARSLTVVDVYTREPSPKERTVYLSIVKHGLTPARDVALAAEAGVAVQAWLAQRERMPIESDALFPANLTGEPIGPTEVYRATERLFKRAKVANRHNRKGLQVLRATFAAIHLGRGEKKHEISARMGLARPDSIEHYTNRRTAR